MYDGSRQAVQMIEPARHIHSQLANLVGIERANLLPSLRDELMQRLRHELHVYAQLVVFLFMPIICNNIFVIQRLDDFDFVAHAPQHLGADVGCANHFHCLWECLRCN